MTIGIPVHATHICALIHNSNTCTSSVKSYIDTDAYNSI